MMTDQPATGSTPYQLGIAAFRQGMKRIPAQDKSLEPFLTGKPGSCIPVLDEWLHGWDDANLGRVESPTASEAGEWPVSETFGDVVYAYTRAQAIEDGVLVDLTHPGFTFRQGLNICQEAGIKFPVAMTETAFAKTVEAEGVPLPPCQDISGRLWDVLWMMKLAIKRQGGTTVRFQVSVMNWIERNGKRINRTKQELVSLKAVCGPGDDAEPVITIMLPEED